VTTKQRAVELAAGQRRWIETHGRDEAGYVARYGDSNAPEESRYGDGGQAIYAADMDVLVVFEKELTEGRNKR
jgi:hypothetical protein